jgi:hypothetical protein
MAYSSWSHITDSRASDCNGRTSASMGVITARGWHWLAMEHRSSICQVRPYARTGSRTPHLILSLARGCRFLHDRRRISRDAGSSGGASIALLMRRRP